MSTKLDLYACVLFLLAHISYGFDNIVNENAEASQTPAPVPQLLEFYNRSLFEQNVIIKEQEKKLEDQQKQIDLLRQHFLSEKQQPTNIDSDEQLAEMSRSLLQSSTYSSSIIAIANDNSSVTFGDYEVSQS